MTQNLPDSEFPVRNAPRPPRLAAYLQLLRLPTVFTAMADVVMGSYVALWYAGGPPANRELPAGAANWLPPRPGMVALLVAASSCLYLAGMALNDFFDRAQDALERPSRPIPSGRISPSAAAWLGGTLLGLGVALALAVSFVGGGWRCGPVAVAIACCVLLYDAALKRTPLGPLAMGACRALNALLGMSIAGGAWGPPQCLIAGGLGLYVAGLTLLARSEARRSHRGLLLLALPVMWLGMALIASFPGVEGPRIFLVFEGWLMAWGLLGAQTGYRVLQAVARPGPGSVQAAVKQSILSLVVFDALIVYAVAGLIPSLCVLILLSPTLVLSLWLYVT